MKTARHIGLAALLALGANLAQGQGAAQAQQGVIHGPPIVYDQRDDPAYQAQQQRYQDRRDDYQAQQDQYRRDRTDYLAARAEYDARYGPGSYERYRTGWYQPYAASPCERASRGNQATGGVIGALAGAAIGSNLAAGGVRTEGAVLGGLVGAALGASIGRNAAQCDGVGYYYSYQQTVPYREVGYDGRSGRYDRNYYSGRRCRLAAAPAYYDGVTDYRYVRVCPDGRGRYRITG